MIDRLANIWSSKRPRPAKAWRWLSTLLTAAMVVYLLYMFFKGNLHLDQIDWRSYWVTLLVILGIYLLSLIIQFFVWNRMISFHHRITWRDASIYARSILMRSLPGGAWHWIGRISLYAEATEVPARVILVGNFLEWGLLILSGLTLFGATLPSLWLGMALMAVCFGMALWLGITWQPNHRRWSSRLLEAFLWVALYGMAWLLATLILYLLVQAVGGAGKMSSWEALHTSTLSGSLGMLVMMLPSSLGIREISLVWLLKAKLTPSLVLLIALMLRLVYMFADIIWGMVGWLVSSLVLRKNQPHP